MTWLEGAGPRPGTTDGDPTDASEDAPVVREMRPGDVPFVAEIERRSFAVPWSEETFRRLLRVGETRAWTAAGPDGEVAGYAVSWSRRRGAQLGNLAVAPERRREGLGRRLVRTAVRAAAADGAEHLLLEVRESNRAALRLYRTAGFRLLGRKRGYYRCPVEDALVMGVDPR